MKLNQSLFKACFNVQKQEQDIYEEEVNFDDFFRDISKKNENIQIESFKNMKYDSKQECYYELNHNSSFDRIKILEAPYYLLNQFIKEINFPQNYCILYFTINLKTIYQCIDLCVNPSLSSSPTSLELKICETFLKNFKNIKEIKIIQNLFQESKFRFFATKTFNYSQKFQFIGTKGQYQITCNDLQIKNLQNSTEKNLNFDRISDNQIKFEIMNNTKIIIQLSYQNIISPHLEHLLIIQSNSPFSIIQYYPEIDNQLQIYDESRYNFYNQMNQLIFNGIYKQNQLIGAIIANFSSQNLNFKDHEQNMLYQDSYLMKSSLSVWNNNQNTQENQIQVQKLRTERYQKFQNFISILKNLIQNSTNYKDLLEKIGNLEGFKVQYLSNLNLQLQILNQRKKLFINQQDGRILFKFNEQPTLHDCINGSNEIIDIQRINQINWIQIEII